jgi:hypothetical protein
MEAKNPNDVVYCNKFMKGVERLLRSSEGNYKMVEKCCIVSAKLLNKKKE